MRSLLTFLLCVSPLAAQVSASLSGTALDPSNAVVSAASIVLTNTDTGAVRRTDTDNAGHYLFAALSPGRYEVRAQKAGFTDEIRSGVNLVVNQDATVDFNLQIGQSTQAVTVNADAPQVNVSTADISGLVGQQQIAALPLNGRSYDELLRSIREW